MKIVWRGLLLIVSMTVLLGCAPVGSSVIVSSQGTPPPVQVTGYPTPGGPVVSTGQGGGTAYPLPIISGTAVSGPNPTAYPGPAATPGGPGEASGKEVTLEQNGQTISLKTGETFLLKLGEIYQWNIQIDRPDVISRIPNIAVIKGAQGIYKANQPGTATLSADGDPLCRQSKPACMIPSIRFSVQVEVKP